MPFMQKIADKLHLGKDKDNKVAEGSKAPPKDDSKKEMDTTTTAVSSPAFDQSKVTVLFVLGGPGAGKGTQSEKIVQDYGFVHLSAGDLLRAEQVREGSKYGQLIRDHIREGTIVPMEVTVELLQNAMRDAMQSSHSGPGWDNGKGRFLIDGFPRKMDQALRFDEAVCLSSLVLFYTCTEEIMLQRLLNRGKSSGREDDNEETIKKRFQTYHETTMPVIEHYEKLGKVAQIDGAKEVDEVYKDTRSAVDRILA